MADQAARTRADAINNFAAALRDLRDSVGSPSFREMSGRSRAISHTTLHEAAQGNRLPSWATTVEFVKACGADPADYRERWQEADRAVRAEQRLTAAAVEPAPEPVAPAPAAPPPVMSEPAAPPTPAWRRTKFFVPALAAVATAVVAVAVAISVRADASHGGPGAAGQTTAARLSPEQCPLHPTNPPAAPAAHPGDASEFVADITLPDCSHLRRGEVATKIWRIKNIGTVTWRGYTLHRLDLPQQRNECQTISDLPIDDTAPGETVDIKTQVTAPRSPGFCFVRFKMMDAAGRVVFPGRRPVNFQLIVD